MQRRSTAWLALLLLAACDGGTSTLQDGGDLPGADASTADAGPADGGSPWTPVCTRPRHRPARTTPSST